MDLGLADEVPMNVQFSSGSLLVHQQLCNVV
jgi:hypothetical protein